MENVHVFRVSKYRSRVIPYVYDDVKGMPFCLRHDLVRTMPFVYRGGLISRCTDTKREMKRKIGVIMKIGENLALNFV